MAETLPSWDKHFIQTADIDATETQIWKAGGYRPICLEESFSGSFNGQNYVIDGLFIDRQYYNYQGLFGHIQDAVIENVGLTNVSFNVNGNAGGLTGYAASSMILNCFATGSINGDYSVGGLLGRNNDSEINNCFSTCSVNGLENVGGLVGNNDEGLVNNSYSCGAVYSDVNDGGLVGSGGGTVINSFWNVETSNQTTSTGGTGKTTLEMQDIATYTNLVTIGLDEPWDFVDNPFDDTANEDFWNIDGSTNNGYPFLANAVVETQEPFIPNPSSLITNLNNYPNPFNPSTTISFQISGFSEIESAAIEIYNLKGQRVKTILINASTDQPTHSATWNGTDLSGNSVSSGIYYYKLNVANSPVKKMLLLK